MAMGHRRGIPATMLTTVMMLTVTSLLIASVHADCYYPNGDLSKEDDIPCPMQQDGAGACCPGGWDCMASGLCYYAAQNYTGRYTCTDKSWASPVCPQICTHGRNPIRLSLIFFSVIRILTPLPRAI